MATRRDVLLEIYNEHVAQARQHEDQREKMTQLVLVVAGAALTAIATLSLKLSTLPLAAMLVPLGCWSYLFSVKLYERNRLHATIAKHFRGELDKSLNGVVGNPLPDVSSIRAAGENEHYISYPAGYEAKRRRGSGLKYHRLHRYWAGLHLGVILLGGMLTALIVVKNRQAVEAFLGQIAQ